MNYQNEMENMFPLHNKKKSTAASLLFGIRNKQQWQCNANERIEEHERRNRR